MSNPVLPNGVSLGGKKWILEEADDDQVARLSQSYNLPEFIARLLIKRGVQERMVEYLLLY